jgi:O-antigen ligase
MNRGVIWEHALSGFAQDPVFGVGPGVWSPSFDQALVLTWREEWIRQVEQAHNQLVQTLAESGLVGAAALAALVVVVGLGAFVARRSTRGASVALFVVLLARMSVESPLSSPAVGPPEAAALAVFLAAMWWPGATIAATPDRRAGTVATRPLQATVEPASLPEVHV